MCTRVWRSRDHLQEVVLPFHHVGLRIELRLSGLAASPFTPRATSPARVSTFKKPKYRLPGLREIREKENEYSTKQKLMLSKTDILATGWDEIILFTL